MDQPRDFIIDMKVTKQYREITTLLTQAGGLPVVVVPLDSNQEAMAQGMGCMTEVEYIEAVRWGYKLSPDHLVRVIPATVKPT